MKILDHISFYIFLATAFLLPFFFLPLTYLSIGVAKGLLLPVGLTLSLLFWLIARLVEGRVTIPKSSLILSGLGLVFTFLLSAIFSQNKGLSFFGFGFEIGTWANIMCLFLAMFLGSIFFKDKKNYTLIYSTLAASFFVTVIPALIFVFTGPDSFITKYLPVSLVGTLSDLSIYSGFILVLSLLSLEFLSLPKVPKMFSWLILAISLFLMVILNFLPVWIVVGIFALFIFIYNLSIHKPAQSRFPLTSFLVVVFSLLFILAFNVFGNSISSYFNINNLDVRPSFSTTYQITKNTLTQDPVFGAGPNRFVNSWLMYKPNTINQTQFWDTNFSFGSGLIPSFFVTTGLLGGLSWIVFLAIFIFLGFRKIFLAPLETSSNFMLLSSFLSALFLWIFTIIYVPSVVLLALAFIMTGIFVGVLSGEKKNNFYNLQFLKDPRLSFLAIFVLVCLIASSIVFGYIFIKKFASAVYFSKSVSAPNTEEGLIIAEENTLKAISLDEKDLYYRSLSQVYLIKLANLVNKKDSTITEDQSKKDMQTLLNQAEGAAKLAVSEDQTNYLNWMILGAVYENVLPLGVQGAYDGAKQAYNTALSLNPKNPSIYLILARLEFANKNLEGVESYIKKALELKPNYTEAINALDSLGSGVNTNSAE